MNPRQLFLILNVSALLMISTTPFANAQRPQGSIVGWGSQFAGIDLSAGFVSISAGGTHNLGLTAR